MPDASLSEAIKEAYASAPATPILYTLELWHPAFSVPIRVVRDRVDLVATLEASAPRNPGEQVTFIAFAFDLVPPDMTSTSVPQCTIEMDNVARDILSAIELTVGRPEMISVIVRLYLADDTSGPENDPPLEMVVMKISADPFRIRAVAGFPDLANRRFPTEDYTAERFPGLIPQ